MRHLYQSALEEIIETDHIVNIHKYHYRSSMKAKILVKFRWKTIFHTNLFTISPGVVLFSLPNVEIRLVYLKMGDT